ncbi:unnamed protein product, partial [Rotaria sp. Silwood2]
MWIVQLALCSDNDHDLESVVDHMKNEYYDSEVVSIGSFGIVLAKMGKFDEVERYFHRSLNNLSPNHYNTSISYHSLGIIAAKKGDYDSAIKWSQKALDIQTRQPKSDYPNTARVHSCIAGAYT